MIIGARLGYVLFYNPAYYLSHPLEIAATWSGGMSFHGGTIGLVVGGWWYARRKKIPFFRAADTYMVTIPIGLALGRLGNFINGELFGRPSELPWAMVFPGGGPVPRHPSQLYEAFFEGLVLFVLLWSLRHRPYQGHRLWPHGSLLALFFIGYGIPAIPDRIHPGTGCPDWSHRSLLHGPDIVRPDDPRRGTCSGTSWSKGLVESNAHQPFFTRVRSFLPGRNLTTLWAGIEMVLPGLRVSAFLLWPFRPHERSRSRRQLPVPPAPWLYPYWREQSRALFRRLLW